jgi:hypothetical protein
VARPHRRDRRPVGREQGLDLGFEGHVEPAEAVVPFARAPGLVGFEIVDAETRMGVDRPERLVLGTEMYEHPRQDEVLEHVREIAGVEGVTVVQGAFLTV